MCTSYDCKLLGKTWFVSYKNLLELPKRCLVDSRKAKSVVIMLWVEQSIFSPFVAHIQSKCITFIQQIFSSNLYSILSKSKLFLPATCNIHISEVSLTWYFTEHKFRKRAREREREIWRTLLSLVWLSHEEELIVVGVAFLSQNFSLQLPRSSTCLRYTS